MHDPIPVFEVSLPEYLPEQEIDWLAAGNKLDPVIEAHYPGRRLAIRGIGLVDHPGWKLDDLVATILELGTDRYDPERKGVHEEYHHPFVIDLFAGPCVVEGSLRSLRSKDDPNVSVMGKLLQIFYKGALTDRGYSVRIDIVMIYDLDQLEPVPMAWTPEGVVAAPALPREECCDFTFKYPDRKRDALLGIIRILR